MDWNRTKTIFIIVFAILNVFLYTLYVDRHTEAQNVQVLNDPKTEERLAADNIQLLDIPLNIKESPYVSGKVKVFTPEEVGELNDQTVTVSADGTILRSELDNPYALTDPTQPESFADFLKTYVINGDQFELWQVNEETREATFFQTVNNRTIYYNQSSYIKAYWNEDFEIVRYEQRMFTEIEEFNQKKDLIPPMTAINTLYSRGHLQPNSTVVSMELGYSTLVQLTETQVFAPTWSIHVKLNDGQTEYFFVNAVEGRIIEFQLEETTIEE